MAYGLPANGELNWDVKLNASIEAVKATADAAVPASEKGAADGVATLGADGKVPAAQLAVEGTASSTTFTPAGNIAATNVQAAIQELDTEKEATGSASSAVATHAAASDPHGDRAYADSAIAGRAFRGARVTSSAAQSIPNNTTTAVTFDTELTDPNGMFTTGTPTRLTIPVGMAGVWLIIARLGYASNATGQRECTIRMNGVNVSVTREAANPTDATWNDITYLGPCIAGDYFEVIAWQTSGASLNTLASDLHTSLTAIYLGA